MTPVLPVSERKLRHVAVSWAAPGQATACQYLLSVVPAAQHKGTWRLNSNVRFSNRQVRVTSDELAIPIMESIACGKQRRLDAINIPNRGWIPNLPDEMVVEVPATSDGAGLHPKRMQPLPEPIAAMIRLQGSINKLLVEAFAEESKSKLLQAVLLEPTVTSYRGAMEMVDEMLALQRDVLPPIH
jgi:alpha-galactosidase/6-phospho-beta-glucosidase family protein